jgi:hypothetical protein
MYDSQLGNMEATHLNVENVAIQSEMARDNMDIVRTLKTTNQVQKELMKDMNIETIDDMVDELQEMQYMTEEFSDAIQRNYEVDLDDEDLNRGI